MMGNLFVIDRSIHAARRYRGEIVLTYAIHYPQYVTPTPSESLREISDYYRNQANYLARSVPDSLYAQAVADYDARASRGEPFTAYEYLRAFDTTYGQDCTISLFFDTYQFTGGAHGNTVRTSDTWDANRARRIPLSALFPQGAPYRARLEAAIDEQIARQSAENGTYYFDDSAALVRENFDEDSFYLTPEALVIYFQQYQIAPYASGIPTFAIPYAQVGARIPTC